MKRAEVWRMWPGNWGVLVFPHHQEPGRDTPIHVRPPEGGRALTPRDEINFPTHDAAMTAALAEVGLTEKNGAPR